MRPLRLLALVLLVPLAASAATVPDDADDWKMIGGVLSLVQQVVHLAANSPDRDAAQKSVEAMVSGQNAQANRIAAGVMDEALQDVPAEQRAVFVAIGRDLLTLARRERERVAAAPERGISADPAPARAPDPVQARKELQAMGLNYWDEQQFLAAARRGDRIAVDLFLAAKGLSADASRNPPPAR
jgi:hypothetical protein